MTTPGPCPDPQCWRELLSAPPGTAPDPDPALMRHLDSCAACQARLQQLAAAEEFRGRVIVHLRDTQAIPFPLATAFHASAGEAWPSGPALPRVAAGQPLAAPAAPPRLGHYEILGELGRGGMGVVYLARDSVLGREVAVKRPSGAWLNDPVALTRFLREARSAAAVASRFAVAIHAVEGGADGPFLVMEYVRGVSLQQRLNSAGPLPVEEIRRVGLAVALGLAAAHERGILHRDIKPGNILLAEDGEVKITDFGLARATGDDALTSVQVLAGTPAYLAPEQIAAQPVDQRADLFSLGSVLYAMCTGVAPFAGSSLLAIVRQVADGTPPPIAERNPAIPDWLTQLVERLHAKDPAQRIASAREVVRLLRQGPAAADASGAERAVRPSGRPVRRRRLFAAGLIVGAAGLLAGILVWSRWRESGESLASGQLAAPLRAVVPGDQGTGPIVVTFPGGREARFSELAAALQAATGESVVTLHGAGPFRTGPLKLGNKPLTLQAAPGSVPVIALAPAERGEQAAPNRAAPRLGLLESEAPLILEGLVLQAECTAAAERCLLGFAGPQIRLRRCRLVAPADGGTCLHIGNAAHGELQDCELHAGTGVAIHCREGRLPAGPAGRGQVLLRNCLCTGRTALSVDLPIFRPFTVNLVDTTVAAYVACSLIDAGPPPAVAGQPCRVNIAAERTFFDTQFVVVLHAPNARPEGRQESRPTDARRVTRQLVWSGSDNVYSEHQQAFVAVRPPRAERPVVPRGLALKLSDWTGIWTGHEVRPRLADGRYAGGERLREQAIDHADSVPAAAFRLTFSDPAAATPPPPGANTAQVGPAGR